MNKDIGGYFSLELPSNEDFIFSDLANMQYELLNTGRNAFEYILTLTKVSKIYIPYFTCDVLLEPILKLKIEYVFYDVDDYLEPIFDFNIIKSTDTFLYTNYFGIKTKYIKDNLLSKIPNLIIDNAQALFSKPYDKTYQFYSPRKFLGLPDGGIVIGPNKLDKYFSKDISYGRMSHLLKRIDLTAEDAYDDFQYNDGSLSNQAIKRMSTLTEKIFGSIDFVNTKQIRIENFEYVHKRLCKFNDLKITLTDEDVPMVYPFRTKKKHLRQWLIQNRIYCATYWPNVQLWCDNSKNAYWLTEEIIAIPIDQRYNTIDMNNIIKHVESSN